MGGLVGRRWVAKLLRRWVARELGGYVAILGRWVAKSEEDVYIKTISFSMDPLHACVMYPLTCLNPASE
jgi:hypothetical protein